MAQVDATGNVVSAPAPTLNLNTPPPDTQFLGGSVSQLPGYVPPDSGRVLQPWQVEDRNSYLQAQKMIAQQNAQQMAAAQQQMAIQQSTGGNPGGISNDLSSVQVSPAMSQQDATNLLSYLASKRLYGNSQAERDYYDRAYKNVTSQLPSAIVSQAENDIRHNKAITGNEFALGDILNRNIGGLAQAGGAAGKFLAPITLGPANLIPGVTGIAQTVGQKVGELAGPGLADIGTGGALTGPFTLQAGQQAIQISRAYEQGQISGKDALIGLAQTAPQLIPALLHGGGKLAEFARSDEGQTFIKDLGTQHAAVMARLSEEGGKLRVPGTSRSVDYTALDRAPQVLEPTEIGYHGTGQRFKAFDADKMDSTALYGPGVYITDNEAIAKSYARTRAKQVGSAGEAVVQNVLPKPGLRVLNMEVSLPADATAVYRRAASSLDNGNIVDEAIDAGKTGKEINAAFQEALTLEHIPKYEAEEVLWAVNQELQRAGYDGIAHTGGIKGGVKHTVTVIFDPNNVRVSTPQSFTARLAEERGSVKLPGGGEPPVGPEGAPRPVGDNSPAPPQAGGVQPNPFEERINRPANQPGGVGVTLSPAVAEFVQGLAESKYLTGTARAVKLKESLGTVASRMENAKLQAISEGKSPAEVAAAVSAARAGARLPEFQPGERLANFTGWKDLHAQGLSANLAGEIDNHQLANFHGILNDIQDPPEGYKGPQPHQAKLLGQVLGPAVEKALPAGPKAWSAYAELRSALGLLPTLKTSLSAHGPFNQLWRVAPGHPFIWLEQSANDLRRFVASPETRAAEWAKIQQDPFITGEGLPYGAGANEGNVRLKQFGPSNLPENLPEEMQAFGQNTVTSRLVNKIPLLTRSKEAYTLTMDAARLALYKSQVQPLLKMVANGEIVPPDRFDAIKQLVNEETGWGNTGEAKPELAPGVPLFFSVHNLVSKPQWVFQMFNKDPVVRAAAIKDVLAFAGFSSAVLGGLKASGAASVNLNPWGSFGDIQVGNVHVNPVRDFAPIIKLIAQVTTPAHLRPTVGGDLPTTRDWRQAIATYARGALGPGASVAADVATGQNYIGQPLGLNAKTVRTEAWDAASPIFINELVEAAKNNQPFSYAMLPYAFGGGSLNIYGPQAGSKASLMQALGLPANATPQQILLAEQKNPQALQDYLNVKKQQSNDFGTYAAASQKALADQQRIDQQFQSGAVNAQQWKDAYHTIQDNLGYLRETLPGLKSANGAAQPKVVSDYYAIYDKYPNAKTDPAQQQQLNDALDQYTANLSASDQKVFDQYVGFGAGTTPLVREYRDTVKGLQKAGIYGVEQKILGQAGIPAQFKSVSDLVNYTVDQIMQSLPQGQRSPALRQLIVNKVSPHFNKLDELVNLSKLALVSGNPQLEAEAVKFGLMQTKAALALSLATSQGSGQ